MKGLDHSNPNQGESISKEAIEKLNKRVEESLEKDYFRITKFLKELEEEIWAFSMSGGSSGMVSVSKRALEKRYHEFENEIRSMVSNSLSEGFSTILPKIIEE